MVRVRWLLNDLQKRNTFAEKFMLKRVYGLGALLPLALAMSACTDPIPAYQDPLPDYPQVHVEAYLLQNLIRVQAPIVSRVGAGQLRVDIPIRNLADRDLPIDFVYYFYDARGVLIAPPSSRQFVSIPRKGISQIEFTSLSAAADFRVEIRYAK